MQTKSQTTTIIIKTAAEIHTDFEKKFIRAEVINPVRSFEIGSDK